MGSLESLIRRCQRAVPVSPDAGRKAALGIADAETQKGKVKHAFLPITREEMKERGIEQFDFVYVIGDAYVDHSSFGPAITAVVLRGGTAIPSASSHSRTGRTRKHFDFR